jgi:glyoxylase-like metal-dependent hydrolase (beta-lactamase superfamily II)
MSDRPNSAEVAVLLPGFPGRSERGYLGWSACYLVTTARGERILFDTGGYNERAVVLAKLAERGLPAEAIDLLVLSHLHFDHAANWDLFPKAELVVHERELDYAGSAEADGAVLRFHAEAIRKRSRVRAVTGDEIALTPELTLLHVPGHTPGALALAAGRSVLCGDAVKSRWDLQGTLSPPWWDQEQAMRSIERLKSLSDLLLPGHDAPLARVGTAWKPNATPALRIFFPDESEHVVSAPKSVTLPGANGPED